MAVYQLEDLLVDRNTMELRRGRDVIDIEPKSFRVLMHLIENRTRVVPKEELIERIWNGAAVTDNSLTRAIAQIRKALGDDARQSRFVETVPTVGYRFVGPVEELATPPVIGEPLNPNPKINWWVPLVAVIAIPMAFLMPYIKMWTSGDRPPPRAVQFTTSSGLDMHPSFSPDGSSIAYASDRNGTFEIYVKQVQSGGTEVAITSDGKNNLEPAWSPDGSQIAYYSAKERGIYVVSSLGGPARKLTEFGSQPTWSADSKRVAFRSAGVLTLAFPEVYPGNASTLWWVSAEGGKPEPLTSPETLSGRHSYPHFSPKSNHLGFLSFQPNRTSSLWEMDPQSKRTQEILRGPPHAYDFTYAADGVDIYLLAFDEGTPGLYLLKRDATTRQALGKPQLLTPIEYVHLRDVAISPQGNRLAYAATSMTSNLWQTYLDGRTEQVTHESTYRVTQPVFSPDGTKIAYFLRRKGQLGDIYVVNADGKNPRQITRNPGQDYMVSWSADGGSVFYVSFRERAAIYQYTFQDGLEKPFAFLDDRKSLARISPDGKTLLYHRFEGDRLAVFVREIASGKETRVTAPDESVGFPVWAQDGQSIAAELWEGDSSHAVILPLTGGKGQRITNRPGHAWVFSFSPDGKQLPLATLWNEPWNIYSQPVGGEGEPRKLTDNKLFRVFLRYPAYSPDGSRVAYELCETKGNLFLADLTP